MMDNDHVFVKSEFAKIFTIEVAVQDTNKYIPEGTNHSIEKIK